MGDINHQERLFSLKYCSLKIYEFKKLTIFIRFADKNFYV